MNYTLIIDAIEKHIHLDSHEKMLFTSMLVHKSVPRKEMILNSGEICKSSNFVVSGCLRAFTTDKKGVEHVLSFAPSGWWIADMYSLISQRPGQLSIESMEDSNIFQLSKVNQELLYLKIPKFERFFRIIIENSLVANQQRVLDSLSITAEERYLKFCNTYPTLINFLPQKQIASYIGVTQEFFSRMRTSLLKK